MDSAFVRHEPCPKCGSKDALGRYSDGHAHCFAMGCKYFEKADSDETKGAFKTKPKQQKTEVEVETYDGDFLEGGYFDLKPRGLTAETLRKWGYMLGQDRQGRKVHIAQHFDAQGNVTFQKLRTADKKFPCIGSAKDAGLYGEWLWPKGLGKRVVVTEGEIDALTVSQIQKHEWPVVSLAFGADSAVKTFKKSFEWLNSFDEIVLAFDNDEAGKKAVDAVAKMFSPGKVKVATFPLKDANEMLLANRVEEMRKILWNAPVWRPGGIVHGSELTVDFFKKARTKGYELPYPKLNEVLHGLRKKELTFVVAGTGIGKSTIVRQIGYHLTAAHGLMVGNIFLEEDLDKTSKGLIAIDHQIPLGVLRENPEAITDEQYQSSIDRILSKQIFFDHFGSLDSEDLFSKLDYLCASGVDFILLDHISILTSGLKSSGEGERKDIDILVTKLRALVQRTGVGIIAICHLKKSEGTAHEEGGRVNLDDMRGSGSLKQLADNVIAMERDQQGDTPDEADIRLLKNREWGEGGVMDRLRFNKDKGLLEVVERSPFKAEESEF